MVDPPSGDETIGESAESAVVTRIFPDEGHGFLLTADCSEVRFTRDAVLRDEFDEMRIGSEVRFQATDGPDGPEATVVDVLSVPQPSLGHDAELLGAEDELPEMPDIWQEK